MEEVIEKKGHEKVTMKKVIAIFRGKNDRMIEVKSVTSKEKVTRILGVKIVTFPPLLQSYFDHW